MLSYIWYLWTTGLSELRSYNFPFFVEKKNFDILFIYYLFSLKKLIKKTLHYTLFQCLKGRLFGKRLMVPLPCH